MDTKTDEQEDGKTDKKQGRTTDRQGRNIQMGRVGR